LGQHRLTTPFEGTRRAGYRFGSGGPILARRYDTSTERKDRLLALLAPVSLLLMLVVWLLLFLISYTLIFGLQVGDLEASFALAGSSLFTLASED
jgi:hypothetical protein